MPARPHRTVDRVTGILETVSLSPRGVTLAELAVAMDAAKTSIQELTNRLLARGYLIEEERRFHLGPGPFILASRVNKHAALTLDHEIVAELGKALGCTVLVGVRVGDAVIFTDYAGQESPSLTFAARVPTPAGPSTRAPPGRSCSPTSPMTRCTASWMSPVPSMRATCGSSSPNSPRSAPANWPFNCGVTIADAFVVATPLLARDGRLIAAISAALDSSEADRLDDLGEELKNAVAALGPTTAPRAAPRPVSVRNASTAPPPKL